MSLLEKIEADLTQAQKEKNEAKVSILRFLLANLHNAQIAKGKDKPLTDAEIRQEITKEVKRHKESIEAFEKANRGDLVEKEKKELDILESYLPEQLTEAEITAQVLAAIKTTGAKGVGDFGKVMAAVMLKIAGRAEGREVAKVVKTKLE